MKKCAIILIIAIAIVIYFVVRDSSPIPTSFEECVEAGNPVMESYPRQCNDERGGHFVEEIEGLNL